MWFSQLPYLYPHPFQGHEGIRKLAEYSTQHPDWLKQLSGINNRTADELEKSMLTELRITWIKSALFIITGIISGCLLIQRKRVGYILAFFLSIIMIGLRGLHMVRYPRASFSLRFYRLRLEHWPVRTIHEFSMQLVLLGTIAFLAYVFLTRKTSHLDNKDITSPCNETALEGRS